MRADADQFVLEVTGADPGKTLRVTFQAAELLIE